MKFEIVKYKTVAGEGFGKAQAVSSAKTENLTIVDITAVRDFAVGDVKKFYVDTVANEYDTFALAIADDDTTTLAITDTISAIGIADPYDHEIKISGTYNGEKVSIPNSPYLAISSGKLVFNQSTGKVTSTSDDAIKYSDLYDAKTAQYLRKDASDTLKVSIKSGTDIIDTISKSIAISDAKPEVTTIEGEDTWTVAPTLTQIKTSHFTDVDDGYEFKVKDQYGVEMDSSLYTVTYKIASVVPNAAGYADNNFKVVGNDQSAVQVVLGAERGDTFVYTIKAGDVTKDVQVTVKGDTNAKIENSDNQYLTILLPGTKQTTTPFDWIIKGLEQQRLDGLQ